MTGAPPPPPFLFFIFKRGSNDDSLCKVYWISICGLFLNWTLSFRCHCHLVEYHTMLLTIQFIQAKYLELKSRLFPIFFKLDHLYQTPSPQPSCRKLGVHSCMSVHLSTVHLLPTSTDTIAWHQLQYCLWSWKTMQPVNLQFLLTVDGPLFIQTMSNRVGNIWGKPISQLIPFCGTRFWAL